MKGRFLKSLKALRIALNTRYMVIDNKTLEPITGNMFILEEDALKEMQQYENATILEKVFKEREDYKTWQEWK